MKKTVILLFLGALTLVQATEFKVSSVLDDYMQAWSEHNISKIDSYYDENVIWYDLPSDTTIKGKEAVTQAITTAFMGYVPNMYWVKSGDVFISGNTITYEWVYGGIFNGSWGEKKIINKQFSIKGISTTTINKNGKIIKQKDYYDMYSFQKQLGVIR
ncbi:ester cyclase [Sulfurimonas sp.]